ncbi:MAG: hypothetical protein ABJQ96_16725, partial [Crocinitomicaceae bacterium]
NKLGHLGSLSGMGNFRPTDSAIEYFNEVTSLIDEQLNTLEGIFNERIDEFNQAVKEAEVAAVKLDE